MKKKCVTIIFQYLNQDCDYDFKLKGHNRLLVNSI